MEPVDNSMITPLQNEFAQKGTEINAAYKKIESAFNTALKSAGNSDVKKRQAFDDYLSQVGDLRAHIRRIPSPNERGGATSPTTTERKRF